MIDQTENLLSDVAEMADIGAASMPARRLTSRDRAVEQLGEAQNVWGGTGWQVRLGRWQGSPPIMTEVDHVITDPPFTDHVSKNQRSNKGTSGPGAAEFELSFGGADAGEVTACLEHCRQWGIAFCAGEQLGAYKEACPEFGHKYIRQGVWLKPNPMPQVSGDRPAQPCENLAIMHRTGIKMRWNGGGHPARWLYPPPRTERYHETQKPLSLMRKLIEQFTNPGDLVWDPYGGSMTTGVACILLGRRFLGHELQPRYAELGAERLQAAALGLTLKAHRSGRRLPDLDLCDLPLFEENP